MYNYKIYKPNFIPQNQEEERIKLASQNFGFSNEDIYVIFQDDAINCMQSRSQCPYPNEETIELSAERHIDDLVKQEEVQAVQKDELTQRMDDIEAALAMSMFGGVNNA